MKGFLKSRKFRQGTMATVITVVVIALIVVVNFIATALTSRYSLTIDLTPQKVFSITDETKEYVGAIDKDITIYVLDTDENFSGLNDYYLQASEVLKKFARLNDRIDLQFIDFTADPTFAQKYPSLQLSTSSILVTSGTKVRDLTPYDLYEIQSDAYGYGGTPTASKAEQVLTSALVAVTSDQSINIAVLGGHNEEDVSAFTSMLGSNNYLIESVNIMTEEIDPAYTIAIIAAPQRDYTEDELRRLDKFLTNGDKYGKTLLYLAPTQQTELPNLDAFLADWGIAVKSGIVYETNTSRHTASSQFEALLDYAEDEYSADVAGAGMPAIGMYARPMEILFESQSSISTSTLLEFGATAGIVDSEGKPADPTGNTIPYMTMSQSLKYDGTTPLKSQVIVCGSSAFVNQYVLANANFANGDFVLGLLDDLSGREEAVHIQSKELSSGTISLTLIQVIVIGVLLTIVLPLTLLISGLVIWARRRHR